MQWDKEASLVTFGFSAFLKLLSMNETPRKTELRRRLGPSTGGYDYHKSFRRLARQYLVNGASLDALLIEANRINRITERQSAIAALQRLATWHKDTRNAVFVYRQNPAVFESPSRLFKVRFEPDFELQTSAKRTAFHLWNTQKPKLAPGPTYAALALIENAYQDQDGAPDDLAVLSMREPPTVYRFSEAVDNSALVASIVEQIEEGIRGAGLPPLAPEDRPTP